MSVGRICQRDVHLADFGESVWKAAQRMHERRVGTLVVLDSQKHPLGIITDRDLVVRVLAQNKDPYTTTVGEVMSRDPETILEDEPIEMALERMRRGVFRRLSVVDPEGRLVGLVSLDDVVMLLAEEMSSIGALLDRETPRAVAMSPPA